MVDLPPSCHGELVSASHRWIFECRGTPGEGEKQKTDLSRKLKSVFYRNPPFNLSYFILVFSLQKK